MSYRRGNIYKLESKETLETCLLKIAPVTTAKLLNENSIPNEIQPIISQFEHTYYLCVNRYYHYVSSMPATSMAGAKIMPYEKFDGIVATLFEMITRQSKIMAKLVRHLAVMKSYNSHFITHLSTAVKFNADFERQMKSYENFVNLASRARNLLTQFNEFFNTTSAVPSILANYQQVKESFDAFCMTIPNRYEKISGIEFAFLKEDSNR